MELEAWAVAGCSSPETLRFVKVKVRTHEERAMKERGS
jgi:hypothetical protein